MKFYYHNINTNKLTHLLADDLFNDNRKMVFDSKTGKIIGHIDDSGYNIKEEEPEPEEQLFKNKKQLSLF